VAPSATARATERSDAEPEQVGRIAARAGAVLTELRPKGDDLEDLFFTLTAPDHEEAA
jgi:hypothetical protein